MNIITFLKLLRQEKARSPPTSMIKIQSKIFNQEVDIMQKYIQDMQLYFELRGAPESTKEACLRRLKSFLIYLQDNNINVDNLNLANIQEYILFLKRDKKLSAGTINNYISAIRLFYCGILEKEWNVKKIPRMKRKAKLPHILAKEDVIHLIESSNNIKHKAILYLIYGSGLRVSEVAKLRISDICSKTMSVRIEDAKHDTNRYSILSEKTLLILREYFKQEFTKSKYTLDDYLFRGQKLGEHINVKTIKNTLIKLRNKLKINHNISAHSLRHCFATHCLEDGVDLALIQQLLGHKNISTTAKYLQMTSKSRMGIRSPLDI